MAIKIQVYKNLYFESEYLNKFDEDVFDDLRDKAGCNIVGRTVYMPKGNITVKSIDDIISSLKNTPKLVRTNILY